MLVLGVAAEMSRPKRPTAYLVLVDTTTTPVDLNDLGSLPTATHLFTSAAEDFPSILNHLAVDVRGWLRDRSVEAATVRRADKRQRASNADGPRYRLLTDGAITAAVREMVETTYLRTGAEIANAWSSSLTVADMDKFGQQLVDDAAYATAAAAALSCLPKP
jgi:hypothetical protein